MESVSGSAADYDEFFTNMRPQLVGLGFALTGNLQVASDLAQEALLRSWVHWDKIRTYQDPNAWARRVLRNLAANHARHLRRAPRPIPTEDVPELDADRVALLQALGHLPRRTTGGPRTPRRAGSDRRGGGSRAERARGHRALLAQQSPGRAGPDPQYRRRRDRGDQMSATEDRVAQAVQEIVEFGAAQPSQFSLADIRERGPRRWTHRAVVVAVAAAILVVFFVPLPHLSLFNRLTATSPSGTLRNSAPVVDVSATPKGWVPVAYGDAQVSVPANWWVVVHDCMTTTAQVPGMIFVNSLPGPTSCQAGAGRIPKTTVVLGSVSPGAIPKSVPAEIINGLRV